MHMAPNRSKSSESVPLDMWDLFGFEYDFFGAGLMDERKCQKAKNGRKDGFTHLRLLGDHESGGIVMHFKNR